MSSSKRVLPLVNSVQTPSLPQHDDMSPITRSAQRMPKAMQM
uniref:Uncharacterized protein n=1 Tax=Rhodnius prolixus TaxID=13249 RepID=T1HV76_RHOPR